MLIIYAVMAGHSASEDARETRLCPSHPRLCWIKEENVDARQR
jgi:hypothetical protein